MILGLVRLFSLLFGAVVLGAVALALAVIEPEPRADTAQVADAAAAARAFDLADEARRVAAAGDWARVWRLSEADINGALAAGARIERGFAGQAAVTETGVAVVLSYPLPASTLWINLSGLLAASEEGLVLEETRLGRVPLPGPLAHAALRLGLDGVFGAGVGRALTGAVRAVATEPPHVAIAIEAGPDDRALIETRVRATLASRAGTEDEGQVARHLAALHAARPALAAEESLVAYLRLAVEQAAAAAAGLAEAEARREMRASLFALAIYCGDPRFGTVIGAPPPPGIDRDNGCHDLRLAGRRDLRRHFAVSAGLYAATSLPAAKGVGELKELLDSNPGGSGFSFDDMAANLAGTRFARELLARPPADWPRLAAALDAETEVMPAIDDLPRGLDEAAFRARFDTVDSPGYRAMMQEIRGRVDALPLYRPVIN